MSIIYINFQTELIVIKIYRLDQILDFEIINLPSEKTLILKNHFL